jgi:DNA-directed RNA polymerase subunit E'/Rpb7
MGEKVRGKIKAGSEKAVFLEIDGKEIWIPKSQIEYPKNYTIEIVISDWIAMNKGVISEEEYNERKASYPKKTATKDDNVPF